MWLEHWYLVWKLRWGSKLLMQSGKPRDTPDKDETHTFHRAYCGHCDFGPCVNATDPVQGVTEK